MGTTGSSPLKAQLNLQPVAGHHVTLRGENESDASSAKGKMKFALWEKSRVLPMIVYGTGVQLFAACSQWPGGWGSWVGGVADQA